MAPGDEPETIFQQDGPTRFVPTGWGRGPWDRNAMHAGATSALLTHLADQHDSLAPMRLTRLSFDILKPIPMAPLDVSATVEREGKRIQLLELVLSHDDTPVSRLRALRMRRADHVLPDDVPQAPGLDALDMPPPDNVPEFEFPDMGDWGVVFAHAMEMRPTEGDLLAEPGPGRCWWRLRWPLIDDKSPSPTARVAAAADFGNGLAGPVPFTHWQYVNADLQVMLQREPVDEWIGLASLSVPSRDGTALTTSHLADRTGQIGIATQSLFIEQRPEPIRGRSD